MQKRIMISVLLCFLILAVWQKIFPVSTIDAGFENTQVIENKEVNVKKEQAQEPLDIVPLVQEEEETVVVLGNGKIEISLSDRGGVINGVRILAQDEALPVQNLGGVDFGWKKPAFYQVNQVSGQEVVFSFRHEDMLIQKTYRLSPDDYLVDLDLRIENAGQGEMEIDPFFDSMLLNTNMLGESAEQGRDKNLQEYSVYAQEKVTRKTGAFKFSQKENKTEALPAEWVGFRNRYYCAIFKPHFSITGYQVKALSEKELGISLLGEKRTLKKGEASVYSSVMFFGPQKASILTSYNMDFEKIHVYFRLGFFNAIAKIIEDMMILSHKIIPNWGISIIFVSMVIYLVMYPMTMKSMVSMRKMQSLQPKIVELREKYESNAQKLNQEIMKLYAENKVNPLGGCLPLLLQMPVFVCLYQVIWRSVLFNGADFLWIKDLSAPDRLILLPQSYPVIGNEINILPILIIIFMVVQQKMTTKNMTVTDPNQIAQQKMMMTIMPIMLFMFFYHIASGLTLYITVFYILSSFTQWRAAKLIRPVNS